MYRIIGGDQQEYGPYTVEQIRELIATRRAGPATLAKSEQTPHWIPLSEFPEFAEDLARAAASPSRSSAMPNGGPPLQMGEIFHAAWKLFTNNAGLLLGANFVAFVISVAIEAVPVVGPLIGLVLTFPLFAGPAMMSLKLARGERTTFADVFSGFGDHFLALAAAGVVVHIALMVGFVLLILPGILILGLWLFAPLNIMDRRMPFWDALEASRKSNQGQWPWYFGFAALLLLTFVAGICCCGIGVFVALPVMNNATAIAYEDSERRALAA
jgi:hypothetical protein